VHGYYHLVPLVCCYCSVGYLSDSIDYSSSNVGVFSHILSTDGETFGFTREHGVQV
jgi:hypothetical protein